MKRFFCFFIILMMLAIPSLRVHASAEGNAAGDAGKEENVIERTIRRAGEKFDKIFDQPVRAELPAEEKKDILKTYLKLYKHSFDGFFLNIKERFSLIYDKFESDTKGVGTVLLIIFFITSYIQGANNKVVVGRNLHLFGGRVAERYRYHDDQLAESAKVGRLVRYVMILEGLILVLAVFRSDGIMFRNLFGLELGECIWRVAAYGSIRLLISFLMMFIPFILAYLTALPIAVIKDLASKKAYERGSTFHAMALDLLDHKVILGVLGVAAGVIFLIVNYVSWFMYLEAAGMF